MEQDFTQSSTFNLKLKALMTLLNISNIRLAHVLNVDNSLISRFKSGQRIPSKDSTLIHKLCKYMYKNIRDKSIREEQLHMLGLLDLSYDTNEETSVSILLNWFFEQRDTSCYLISGFLNRLDKYNTPFKINLLPLDKCISGVFESNENALYEGTNGLRRAVIRFLGTIASSDNLHNLKLYSDQNLNWMSSDLSFEQKWISLMYYVLLKKNNITVIHNIERDLKEMIVGIEKWLPLYMTGLVQGYYCKKHADNVFTHTYFIASNTAAVHSSIVIGTEDNGLYKYVCDKDKVKYYEQQFNMLLKYSKPLIQVFNRLLVKQFMLCIGEMTLQKSNYKSVLNTPPIETMSAKLLNRILARSNLDKSEIEHIVDVYKTCKLHLNEKLNNGKVIEFIYFPTKTDFENSKVPLNLKDTFINKEIYYEESDYIEHINYIISLLNNPNYDVIPLAKKPLSNIQLFVQENTGAVYYKTDVPSVAFMFNHPSMCNATSEYIDVIVSNSRVDSIHDVDEYLKSIISSFE